METPTHIHFFSWETRISVELPVGFEEELEDPENHCAIYADDLDELDERGARIMAKMTAVPGDLPEAYLSIAEASAGIGSRTLEHREECLVDGAPAVRQVFSYHDEESSLDVFRHETFAQMANVVFSLTCLAPMNRSTTYAPAFDHASCTARFILLPQTGTAE